jgi:sphinganine C4-monooxygenase
MLMHQNQFVYRHVHSLRHRVVAPYALVAQYNHPVEALILGGIGVFVCGMSPLTSAYFLSLAMRGNR